MELAQLARDFVEIAFIDRKLIFVGDRTMSVRWGRSPAAG
jgi:hypothetical protein